MRQRIDLRLVAVLAALCALTGCSEPVPAALDVEAAARSAPEVVISGKIFR